MHERTKAKKAFFMEAEESAGGYEMAPEVFDHGNVKDLDMPTSSVGQAGSAYGGSDYRPIESQADLKKVFLGASSFHYSVVYDPQKVLSVYFGEAKSTGIS